MDAGLKDQALCALKRLAHLESIEVDFGWEEPGIARTTPAGLEFGHLEGQTPGCWDWERDRDEISWWHIGYLLQEYTGKGWNIDAYTTPI